MSAGTLLGNTKTKKETVEYINSMFGNRNG